MAAAPTAAAATATMATPEPPPQRQLDPGQGDSMFRERLLRHVAICHDVVLEETIRMRDALRVVAANGAADADAASAAAVALNEVLPMRPIRHSEPAAVISWSEFVGSDEWRPLDLLLEQSERLLRGDHASVDELARHRHFPDPDASGLAVLRRDGTPMPEGVEPCAPLMHRVHALKKLAGDDGVLSSADPTLGAVRSSVLTVCEHYRAYVRLLCDFDDKPPWSCTFSDLLAVETQRAHNKTYVYVGGNATLGGASTGGRYFRVSQRAVARLTRLDENGQQPEELTTGSHPTYADATMPLFFKSTALDYESTLGTTKEQSVFELASLLFGRGVAGTALATVARHTTVNVGESKRDQPLLRYDIFRPDPAKFMNAAAFDNNRADFDLVRQLQQMFPRLMQVADKAEGRLLGQVLADPDDGVDALDPHSLSETVLFTIITTADDAKGDNFIVDDDGVIVGIDNDHTFEPPCVKATWLTVQGGGGDGDAADTDGAGASATATPAVVQFKNILLCHADVLRARVHPGAVKLLAEAPIEAMLVDWLGSVADYGDEIARLRRDGALEDGWVSEELGPSDAAARVLQLWNSMRAVARRGGAGEVVTHGDLFRAALPRVARYYERVRALVREEMGRDKPSAGVMQYVYFDKLYFGEHDRVLRWLYYQDRYSNAEYTAGKDKMPRPPLLHDDGAAPKGDGAEADPDRRRWRDESDFGGITESGKLAGVGPAGLGSAPSVRESAGALLATLLESMDVNKLEPVAVKTVAEAVLRFCTGEQGQGALPASWRLHGSLPFKLIRAHVRDESLLSLVGTLEDQIVDEFSTSETLTECAVSTAVERIVSAATSAATRGAGNAEAEAREAVATIEVQLRWIAASRKEGLDNFAQEPPLCVVSQAFVDCHKLGINASGLNRLFVVLVRHGATTVGRATPIVRHWGLLGGDDAHADGQEAEDARAVADAIRRLAGRSCVLGWKLALKEHVVATLEPSRAAVDSAVQGQCALVPLSAIVSRPSCRIVQCNTTGRRAVAMLASQAGSDLYLKIRPELPGVECMVRELGRLLFGPDAMPHVELARWVRRDVGGVDWGDPVLLSQGVRGPTLHDVLKSDNPDSVLGRLDPKSLSEAIILAVLTMPEDGKPDNYICEPTDDDGTAFRVVCIDNDHAFAPPLCPGESKGTAKLVVKSILFCLDQMHDAVHPDVCDALCSANFKPLDLVDAWLDKLEHVNKMHHALFEHGGLGPRLKLLIGRAETCTHMDVLAELEPQLAVRYAGVPGSGGSLWDRFKEVDGAGFELIEGAFCTSLGTHVMMTSLLQQLKGQQKLVEMVQAGVKCSPVQAREELARLRADWESVAKSTLKLVQGVIGDGEVDAVTSMGSIPSDVIEVFLERVDFGAVSKRHQRRMLQMLAVSAERLTRAVLTGFSALDQASLLALAPRGGCLTVLKLTRCGNSAVSSDTLVKLASQCPSLTVLAVKECDGLRQIANIRWSRRLAPVRFASLEMLRVTSCPNLHRVLASFAGTKPCRVVVEGCASLSDVRLSGNVDWKKCPDSQYFLPDLDAHDPAFLLARGALAAVVWALWSGKKQQCSVRIGRGPGSVVVETNTGCALCVDRIDSKTLSAVLAEMLPLECVAQVGVDGVVVPPDASAALVQWLRHGDRKVRFATDEPFVTSKSSQDLLRWTKLGRAGVVRALINANVDVNGGRVDDGVTSLHVASFHGSIGMVRTLLEANAILDRPRTDNGATALHVAAERGHLEVVLALISASASVGETRKDNGATPLHVASSGGNVDIVRALIDAKADVNRAVTDSGFTPLLMAASCGRVRAVQTLVAANASVGCAALDGSTPLSVARGVGDDSVVAALKAAGATK